MKNSGKLVLIPTSGLGNRIRIMAVAIKLARESGKKIKIYWNSNEELHAQFDDLFEPMEGIEIKKIPFKYKAWIRMSAHSAKLFGLDKWYLNCFQYDFVFLDNMAEKVWHNQLKLQQEVDKAEDVLICSCQEFNYFELEDYRRLFVPKAVLQQKINKVCQNFNRDTIGVHIRGTDQEASKKYSPLSLFIMQMEKEIGRNPAVTFFLSTDEEKNQEELLKKFGGDRILYHKKIFDRHVTQGMRDAVVDLFCLSKTSKIYGSYFSSFSEVAGRIGQIPVQVLKNIN